MNGDVYVPLVALVDVNGGRGMIPPGERFYADVDRTAELIILGFADLLPVADEVIDTVLARTDEPDMLALIDAQTDRMLREAWADGMRPD